MFIEPGNTITYSITAPMTLVEDMTFEQAYAFMDQWVIEALGGVGIKAWYQPLNDITSSAGKLAGAAQTRRPGAVLDRKSVGEGKSGSVRVDIGGRRIIKK